MRTGLETGTRSSGTAARPGCWTRARRGPEYRLTRLQSNGRAKGNESRDARTRREDGPAAM